MEENGYQSHFCWSWIYKETTKVLAVHSTNWSAFHQSSCDSPRTEVHFQPWHNFCEEKPKWSDVHFSWCYDKGNNHWGTPSIFTSYCSQYFCVVTVLGASHGSLRLPLYITPSPPLSRKLLLTIVFFQVNVSELGLVTPAGKVVWGEKFASFLLFLLNLPWVLFNKPNCLCCREICSSYKQPGLPENDGCINAVLLILCYIVVDDLISTSWGYIVIKPFVLYCSRWSYFHQGNIAFCAMLGLYRPTIGLL